MESTAVLENTSLTPDEPATRIGREPRIDDVASDVFVLAAWMSGLQCFLVDGGEMFGDRTAEASLHDNIWKLRIARAGLQRCSRMSFRILASAEDELVSSLPEFGLTADDLRSVSSALRTPLLAAESVSRAESLSVNEWQAWCRLVLKNFDEVPAFAKLLAAADWAGKAYVPKILLDLLDVPGLDVERAELRAILPRFGRVLGLLSIIGRMLETDQPLKPSLLIFSKISEQTSELISYLDRRAERSSSKDEDFLGALDGAAYTASIELKKALDQELTGIAGIRPATTVFARTESAHAMLTESFQHILTGFARHLDPAIDAFALFPSFDGKLNRSRVLRDELYAILRLVQKAEKDPDKAQLSALNSALSKYMDEALGYLFYKDTETFERFVEEILVARQKTDLVPILHRFGAYLETLFAQVNMRAVLERHPFEAPDL